MNIFKGLAASAALIPINNRKPDGLPATLVSRGEPIAHRLASETLLRGRCWLTCGLARSNSMGWALHPVMPRCVRAEYGCSGGL